MAKEMFSYELYTIIIFHMNVLRPFSSLLAKVYMCLNVGASYTFAISIRMTYFRLVGVTLFLHQTDISVIKQ